MRTIFATGLILPCEVCAERFKIALRQMAAMPSGAPLRTNPARWRNEGPGVISRNRKMYFDPMEIVRRSMR